MHIKKSKVSGNLFKEATVVLHEESMIFLSSAKGYVLLKIDYLPLNNEHKAAVDASLLD